MLASIGGVAAVPNGSMGQFSHDHIGFLSSVYWVYRRTQNQLDNRRRTLSNN